MVKYSPIESEFASSEEEAAYDAWFRAKVERSLRSTAPRIPHEERMVRPVCKQILHEVRQVCINVYGISAQAFAKMEIRASQAS
jgi:hypothetical protein